MKIGCQVENIPDLEPVYKDFYDKLDDYYNLIMAWSIAHSRIGIDVKIKRFEEFYSDRYYYSFYRIGKKLKNVNYFRWLYDKIESR